MCNRAPFFVMAIVLSVAFVLSACQPVPLPPPPAAPSTPVPQTEINKQIVRRYADEVWSRAKLDVIDEIVGDSYVFHDPMAPGVEGREALKQLVAAYHTAFPDLYFTVEELIAEGDWVANRWTAVGTHQGDLMGIPSTGKKVTWSGITIYRFADGKIVETWWAWDALGLLQQLGVIPLPPAALKGAHEAFQKVLNAYEMDQWPSFWTDDIVWDYVPLPTPISKDGILAFFTEVFQGFPDWHVDPGLVLVSGNILVEEHMASGTQTGEWQGIPPTGKSYSTSHIDIWEFDADKVKRVTTYDDSVGQLIQLGAMPAPELPEFKPSFELPAPEPTGLSPLEALAELHRRWNAHDLTGYAAMIQPDADVLLGPLGVPMDREAFIGSQELYFQAYPDLKLEETRNTDLGDGWVLSEVVFSGTNDGPYFGAPASNKSVSVRGAVLYRFDKDGLVTYLHAYWDELSVLQQQGRAPSAEAGQAVRSRAQLEAHHAAINAHDMDRWLSDWADDAVWDYVPLPAPMNKEETKAFFDGVFQGLPDFYVPTGHLVISGTIAVEEHPVLGTHTGDLEFTGLGTVPATGKRVQVPHMDIWEFDGNKVKRVTSYIDLAGMLVQLGVMPAPELPELKPSFELPDSEPTGLAPLEAQKEAMARWNTHDMALWAKIIRPNVDAFYGTLGQSMDRDELVALEELYIQAFPDVRGDIVHLVDLGNGWVLTEAVFTGKNDGPFFGIPATGRPAKIRIAWLARFDAEGLMTYFHLYFDNLTMLQQLGLAPAAGGSGQ